MASWLRVPISVRTFVAAASLCGFVAACSNEAENAVMAGAAGGSSMTEFGSLVDWVSYVDQVSVVRVVDENEIDPDAPRDERSVGREVTVEVERTVWAKEAAESEVSFVTDGWQSKGGELRPFATADGPRLEVGGRYLIALADFGDKGAPEWGAYSADSIFLVEDGSIRAGDRSSPTAEALDGTDLDALETALASTAPDPLAQKYADRPLPDQLVAVRQDRDGQPVPPTPESSTPPG